jgi:hypothetical protein
MPLTAADDAFLKKLLGNLADEPLRAGSRFYEPIHTVMDDDDPVWLMQRHVELNAVKSLQLFSGFRGAGKTTELLRLKAILEKKGYIVLYADALAYMNPSEPVEISDLIMVLAGSFSDALDNLTELDVERESYWTRFANYLTNTNVTLGGAEFKGEAGIGSVKAGMAIKAEFKTGSSFRQKLQTALSGRLSELKAEADLFFEDGIKAVQEKLGTTKQVVFIFDQLEQLRGNYQNWQSVIRSVEQVFTIHLDKLALPYIHAIYAVPPWLKFLTTLDAPMTILPTVHLWNNDPSRSTFDPGWTTYHALLQKRLGDAGTLRLFGNDEKRTRAGIDRLIGACGGHVRDLLRLFQEMIKRVASLPVTDRVLDSVINNARRDFLPIALDDAKWLAEIGHRRDTALQHIDERSIERLSNFLDQHRVIYFVNGAAWYDIHPLIREEVKRVVEAGDSA